MIYLVTGGAGFIGSYVVRNLLKAGHKVVSYQRSGVTPLLQELVPQENFDRLQVVQGNITDLELLSETIKQHHPEMIVHFAGIMVPLSEDVPMAIQTNIIGTNNVFEAAKKFNVKRVVWSSSNSVYGNLGKVYGNNVIDDSHEMYGPMYFYGATKVMGELMAKQYITKYGMDIICLRFPRTVGIGKKSGGAGVFLEFLRNVSLDNPVTIRGGDTSWAYLYIEDAATVTVKACEAPTPKTKMFNLHTGIYYNGWELAEMLTEINPQAKITVEPGKVDYNYPMVDISAAQKELGFSPLFSYKEGFKEGLRYVLNYFRKQNNLPTL
jgi:nucleoside-diphosphate-sugar epimerase